MKKIELRDIQLQELEILKSFVDICNKESLTYFLSGGTYLGAIRHQGFIPWDDDVDVAMPRRDYERFLDIADKSLPGDLKIRCFTKEKGVLHYFAKIETSKYQMIDHTASFPRKVNIWIDIFPLDGLPNVVLFRKIHCFRLMILRALFKYSLFDTIVDRHNSSRPWYEKILYFIGLKIKFTKILNPYKRMYSLDKALNKYDFYHSKYVLNFMGAAKLKSIMDREKVYGNGAIYNFEGCLFNAPKDYNSYLNQIYGDYMKLPPENLRNRHLTQIVIPEDFKEMEGP